MKRIPLSGRVYYSIDTASIGYPIYWLDQQREKHIERLEIVNRTFDPGDVSQEFQNTHPGAVYLKWGDLMRLMGLAEAEKAKLADWNARANR